MGVAAAGWILPPAARSSLSIMSLLQLPILMTRPSSSRRQRVIADLPHTRKLFSEIHTRDSRRKFKGFEIGVLRLKARCKQFVKRVVIWRESLKLSVWQESRF